MEKQKKQRLDVLLVEKGMAPSREKAKAIIMAGIVYVDGNKEDKAGTTFPENAVIEVKGKTLPYGPRIFLYPWAFLTFCGSRGEI